MTDDGKRKIFWLWAGCVTLSLILNAVAIDWLTAGVHTVQQYQELYSWELIFNATGAIAIGVMFYKNIFRDKSDD